MPKHPAPPRKRSSAGRKPAAAASARPLPDPGGDAPLELLDRDRLSVFLFVALTPDESKAMVKDLGLTVPGFRQEALGDVERCDVLADEIRAAPEVRRRVLDLLRKAFGAPPLVDVPLHPVAADDLLVTGDSDHGLTLALWRLLSDPDAEVRARALPVLDALVKEHYGPPPPGAKVTPAGPAGEKAPDLTGKVAALEKAVEEGKARLESQRKKGEEQREKLQEWLREARARAASSTAWASRAREQAEAALAAAKATDAAAEAHRARTAAKEQESRAERAEALLARAAEREQALLARLEAVEARREQPAAAGPAAPEAAAGDEVEEVPATFLLPIFSREFYDSLAGWDRRIQRAAFKQAYLLAQDHRHPSLRALALEGLPGYYRVRVATDVRLLYRRSGDRQNEIEILSLIDREDLDRYVRQAKTRG